MAFMLEEDGLPRDEAVHVAHRSWPSTPRSCSRRWSRRSSAWSVEPDEGSPLQGALVMGGAFGLGASPPILPHLFLTGGTAVSASVVATLAVLFGDRRGEEPMDAPRPGWRPGWRSW